MKHSFDRKREELETKVSLTRWKFWAGLIALYYFNESYKVKVCLTGAADIWQLSVFLPRVLSYDLKFLPDKLYWRACVDLRSHHQDQYHQKFIIRFLLSVVRERNNDCVILNKVMIDSSFCKFAFATWRRFWNFCDYLMLYVWNIIKRFWELIKVIFVKPRLFGDFWDSLREISNTWDEICKSVSVLVWDTFSSL